MLHTLIKIGAALLGLLLAFWILKNVFGLIIGVALAGLLYVGTTKLLEKK
ncbi:hypothetical protein [Sphingomicrobium astaxanthinifaciens]|nr:hypothetical protein [Sphingomicrobium astaxanthinifaciens]MCJ7422152.1 hypothetical protein [Sphingomicrobium astaxanthinifaciens]